jgi:adenylate cyclase
VAREIERKFLVEGDGWRDAVSGAQSEQIVQGYLHAGESHSVRIRLRDSAARLTVKGATTGITRDEFDYEIPPDDARAMLDLCGDLVVEKRRYVLEYGDHEWIIDEFTGDNEGLLVAEIELDDESQGFDRPDWLGREVSGLPEYYNANLARTPYRLLTDKGNTDTSRDNSGQK